MTAHLDESRARAWIHRELDGETLASEERRRLDAHLAGCAACRTFRAELARVQEGLRALPADPFPERALEDVLARTSRRTLAEPLPFRARPARRLTRRLAWAAAAAIALAGVLGVYRMERIEKDRQAEETARALEQVRQLETVFKLTSSAIDRSTRTAVREVVADEVAPALRRIPVRFPPTAGPGGTGVGENAGGPEGGPKGGPEGGPGGTDGGENGGDAPAGDASSLEAGPGRRSAWT